MNKKSLLLLELSLLCLVSAGYTKKESKPKFMSVASVVNENNLGYINYPDIPTYDYVKEVAKRFECMNECNLVIEKYCNIYNIDSNVVKNIVCKNTNNYTSENFQNNKNIYSLDEKYNEYDLQVLLLVRDIYNNPENYDLCKEDITVNYDDSYDENIRDFVSDISNLLGMDSNITLSIACAESYYFEASIATNKNNPYAINTSNGFKKFDNIYQGIIEGIINLKENYIDYGLTTYELISSKYCPNSSSNWTSLVKGVENELKNGRILYDEESNNKEMTK